MNKNKETTKNKASQQPDYKAIAEEYLGDLRHFYRMFMTLGYLLSDDADIPIGALTKQDCFNISKEEMERIKHTYLRLRDLLGL